MSDLSKQSQTKVDSQVKKDADRKVRVSSKLSSEEVIQAAVRAQKELLKFKANGGGKLYESNCYEPKGKGFDKGPEVKGNEAISATEVSKNETETDPRAEVERLRTERCKLLQEMENLRADNGRLTAANEELLKKHAQKCKEREDVLFYERGEAEKLKETQKETCRKLVIQEAHNRNLQEQVEKLQAQDNILKQTCKSELQAIKQELELARACGDEIKDAHNETSDQLRLLRVRCTSLEAEVSEKDNKLVEKDKEIQVLKEHLKKTLEALQGKEAELAILKEARLVDGAVDDSS